MIGTVLLLVLAWIGTAFLLGVVVGSAIRQADEAEVQQAAAPTRAVERAA